MPDKRPRESVKGFSKLNTDGVSSHLDKSELRVLENMVWTGENTVQIRLGSSLYKAAGQTGWGSSPVIAAVDFDLDGADVGDGAKELYALKNGELFLNVVDNYVNSSTNFTRINGINGSTPALNTSTTNKVFFAVLNNVGFITDETQNFYSFNKDAVLSLVPDPDGFSFEMTVASGVTASVGATYSEASSDRKYYVTEAKVSGTTVLKVRQTAGTVRPGVTGTLNKTSGTGTDPISFTGVTYPEKFIACTVFNGRIFLLSNLGYFYLSQINAGTILTGADTDFIQVGLEDSLKITNLVPFKRGLVITSENAALRKQALSVLTGYRIYSLSTPDIVDGIFKNQRESKMLGVVGESGQEVGNGFIGLTKNGFISFSALDANTEFGLVDGSYISRDIQNLLNRVNWKYSNKIVSAVDLDNQRYLCAVPLDGNTQNNAIFVYDFKNSIQATANTAAMHKWSVFAYSLGENYINNIFTIRGKPYLAVTNGSIIETEVANTYLDSGLSYISQFETKANDFGDRSTVKQFQDIYVDLLVSEEMKLQIYGIRDEQVLSKDFLGKQSELRTIIPKTLSLDEWTDDSDDVWTTSPFDVWERPTAEEYSFHLGDIAQNGIQLSIRVRDSIGGKFWGATGYSLVVEEDGELADTRPY